MSFDAGTWWLILILVGSVTGALTNLIKRAVFGKVDAIESRVEHIEKNYTLQKDHDTDLKECKEDIKSIRKDYTPKDMHEKDFDECRNDIKNIKDDYITKQDFFRWEAKVDRKLDYISDILLKNGGK